ncbi:MAG: ATP-binding protein [Thermoguttaceae bacterium]
MSIRDVQGNINPVLLATMADHIPGAVWATDSQLLLLASFGAEGAAFLPGSPPSAGKPLAECLASENGAAALLAAHRRALEGEPVELDYRAAGRTYRVRLERLLDPSGAVLGCLGFACDVTARKQIEDGLRRELRMLKHLLDSSDHERQIIAYEIHDGLAQQLAGAIMQLQTFARLKNSKPKEAAEAFDAGMTMLRQGHFEARRLIGGVRPPILDESGVVPAIAHLVHEASSQKGPQIEYHAKVEFDRLAPILENAIYRVSQEALANACNHSKSPKVRVSLRQHGEQLRLEVRDWGIGFAPENVRDGSYGLEGIRQRVRLLGGKCSVRSTPGAGTRVTVELPLARRE